MHASLTAFALSLVGDQQNCTHCYTNNVIYVTQSPVIAMTIVYSTVQYMATQTYTVNTHTYMIHTVTYYNITYRMVLLIIKLWIARMSFVTPHAHGPTHTKHKFAIWIRCCKDGFAASIPRVELFVVVFNSLGNIIC